MTKPTVLFVCVKNGGKSQMAAGLMRKIAGETVAVYSAGTAPGNALNDLSAQSLLEIGVDITAEHPKLIDPALVREVDLVVTLGREAHVDPVPGTRFENWDTDEPSERGIDGIDRMRLIRDDIAAPVEQLADQLTNPRRPPRKRSDDHHRDIRTRPVLCHRRVWRGRRPTTGHLLRRH